jgi:hypothetical protein
MVAEAFAWGAALSSQLTMSRTSATPKRTVRNSNCMTAPNPFALRQTLDEPRLSEGIAHHICPRKG